MTNLSTADPGTCGLYAYQAEGVKWLLSAGPKGRLLADAPGAGKSRQVLEAARRLSLLAEGRGGIRDVLIVCPKSVAGSWEQEVSRWWTAAVVSDITDSLRPDAVSYVAPARVFITWPQALANVLGWQYGAWPRGLLVVLDEPHEHRSLHSKWVKALASWTRLAARVWGVDGTPVFNRVDDLYVVLCILGCAPTYASWASWKRTGCVRSELVRLGVVLRRELSDIEGDFRLPIMRRTMVRSPPPSELLASDEWRHAATAGAIRVVAGAHKWRLIERMLDAGRVGEFPTLVWHVHKAGVAATFALLRGRGLAVETVTGVMSDKKRRAVFAAFISGTLEWLVLTQCAQAGVQLQRAQCTIVAETPYEPKAQSQATARMWRLGQLRPSEEITLAWDHDCDAHVIEQVIRKEAQIVKAGF